MQRMQVSGDAASTARRFARELHNKWGVGDGSCSDGVLMLLSIEDRQVLSTCFTCACLRISSIDASQWKCDYSGHQDMCMSNIRSDQRVLAVALCIKLAAFITPPCCTFMSGQA